MSYSYGLMRACRLSRSQEEYVTLLQKAFTLGLEVA
jgi:hypothetical protein